MIIAETVAKVFKANGTYICRYSVLCSWLHCGALTDEMVDKHRCLEKECYHFYAVIDEERM